jgi:transcriptional regulator with XRE-family HTH domain
MDVAKRFAANLVHARKAAGISQEELGFRASLHRTQIGILERGVRLPRIDTLVRLAGALDLTSGQLLDGIVWRPGTTWLGQFEEETPAADETKAAKAQSQNPE